MALIKCKECGKDVSTKAKKCPACGAPVESMGPVRKLFNGIFALLLGAMFLFLVFNDSGKEKEPPAPAPKPEISDAECMKDIQCWSRRTESSASWRCEKEIEKLPSYAYRWTDKFMEPKFSMLRWVDQATGKITFIGDKIELQNQFGAYQRYVYECDFDPSINQVLDARLFPGQL